jgi:hypothetical protein
VKETTHNLRTSLQGVWERLQARAPARYLLVVEWQGDDESAVSVGLDLGDGTPRGHSVPFGRSCGAWGWKGSPSTSKGPGWT